MHHCPPAQMSQFIPSFLLPKRAKTTITPTLSSKKQPTLEVSLDSQAPGYSSYSPDSACPPPPYYYGARGVEEDLSHKHLSQREALVMLEKEARAAKLEEKRRKLLQRDAIMDQNLCAFGL